MEIDRNTAAPAKRKKKSGGGLGETTRFLLLLFAFALVLRTFVVTPFFIPSGSMLPRMLIGDYLFVAKWPYGFSRFSMPFGISPDQAMSGLSCPDLPHEGQGSAPERSSSHGTRASQARHQADFSSPCM